MPQRVAMKPDPLGVPRNPLAVYLLALALLSGVLTLAGLTTAKSAEETLNDPVVRLWGFMLVFGSGHTLLGMFWQGEATTGLLMKRIGMFSLTVASAIYGLLVLAAVGVGGSLSAGLLFGFSVACGIQYKRLNDRVRAIIAVTQERRGRDDHGG